MWGNLFHFSDHYGNVTAQLEYSTVSERWNFPALYHQKSFQSADASLSLDVIFIDTVDLAGSSAISDEADPHYYDKLAFRPKEAAATQWDWIETQLKASTADYLIVAGHYPMYSVCSHGPTSNLIENLKPLLIEHGAHYMAGHDHCM
jgi:tartrate-resistant acid phosphatase type 5